MKFLTIVEFLSAQSMKHRQGTRSVWSWFLGTLLGFHSVLTSIEPKLKLNLLLTSIERELKLNLLPTSIEPELELMTHS
jgi:hypothetical protein